ncbi:unnamed protein product, partial [Symbiodinium sp. CCMP2456]
ECGGRFDGLQRSSQCLRCRWQVASGSAPHREAESQGSEAFRGLLHRGRGRVSEGGLEDGADASGLCGGCRRPKQCGDLPSGHGSLREECAGTALAALGAAAPGPSAA